MAEIPPPRPPRDFEDDDFLYRRVLAMDVPDNAVKDSHCPTQQWRRNLSCDWSLLRPNPADMIRENPGYLLRISVEDCRRIGLTVRYEPEDDNPAHMVLVLPTDKTDKKSIAEIRNKFLEKGTLFKVENSVLRELGPARGCPT